MNMQRLFYVEDEKFGVIKNELRRRDWAATDSEINATLVWSNLVYYRKHFYSYLKFSPHVCLLFQPR